MELKGRRVLRFRCAIDPSIGPFPKNAFDCDVDGLDAELTPIGVYVKYKKRQHHPETETIVPYANCQSIKLRPLPPKEEAPAEKKAA